MLERYSYMSAKRKDMERKFDPDRDITGTESREEREEATGRKRSTGKKKDIQDK